MVINLNRIKIFVKYIINPTGYKLLQLFNEN